MAPLSELVNHQVRLARRPVGLPTRAEWSFTAEPVEAPAAGGVVVKTLSLSLDPAMRGWMNEARSYIPPVAIDAVMRAGGIGVVVASDSPAFAIGERVSGALGVQEYATFTDKQVARGELAKVDLRAGTLTQWLNVLGMPGMTGYFGLLDVGQAKAGETVVVSGAPAPSARPSASSRRSRAAASSASPAGRRSARGSSTSSASTPASTTRPAPIRDGLKAHCPDGIDVYFDNVGGEILDAVLAKIRRHARIVICGAISQYNNTEPVKGPANYLSLLVHRARMEGMVVFDYTERFPGAIAELAGYLKDGRMKSREDVVVGIDTFPEALLKLFRGENFGKLVLQVAKD